MCSIDWDLLAKFSAIITSVIAVAISIYALKKNATFSNKNITLSIQQAIFKIVVDKAHDCNDTWKNEPQFEKDSKDSPHFLVTTELIVGIEVIDNAFILFGKNSNDIEQFKNDYFKLYWKQLIPDVRGWVKEVTPVIKQKHNDVFFKQIETIHNNFSQFFE